MGQLHGVAQGGQAANHLEEGLGAARLHVLGVILFGELLQALDRGVARNAVHPAVRAEEGVGAKKKQAEGTERERDSEREREGKEGREREGRNAHEEEKESSECGKERCTSIN